MYEELAEAVARFDTLKSKPTKKQRAIIEQYAEDVKKGISVYTPPTNGKAHGISKLAHIAHAHVYADIIAQRKQETAKMTARVKEVRREADERKKRKHVEIEYLDEYRTEWFVNYGAKRRARYRYLLKSELNDNITMAIDILHKYVVTNVDKVAVLKRMDEIGVVRLAEKLTTVFCKSYAPAKNYGIDKASIRCIVKETLEHLRNDKEVATFPYIDDNEV